MFALLILVITLTSTALTLAEQQTDQATLAALGATRGTRRVMAAAQAFLLAAVGCVLGVAVGLVPGIAISRPLTSQGWTRSPGPRRRRATILVIPWLSLLVVGVAGPAGRGRDRVGRHPTGAAGHPPHHLTRLDLLARSRSCTLRTGTVGVRGERFPHRARKSHGSRAAGGREPVESVGAQGPGASLEAGSAHARSALPGRRPRKTLMSPLASYRRLFTLAGPLYVAVAFVGRLPLAMAQMGTLLLVAGTTGSYGTGGAAAGALAVANAVGAPVAGSLADRVGQRPVVLVQSVLGGLGLLALVALAQARGRPRPWSWRWPPSPAPRCRRSGRWPGCAGARSPARRSTTSRT